MGDWTKRVTGWEMWDEGERVGVCRWRILEDQRDDIRTTVQEEYNFQKLLSCRLLVNWRA